MIENHKKTKMEIKENGTIFDKFMEFIFSDKTILFQDFLENTSVYFDNFIQDTTEKERLKFIAGKLLMEKNTSAKIHFTAEFYFQNSAQQWILKKKEEDIPYSLFTDWEISPELKQLQKEKKLEFPIDPPVDAR